MCLLTSDPNMGAPHKGLLRGVDNSKRILNIHTLKLDQPHITNSANLYKEIIPCSTKENHFSNSTFEINRQTNRGLDSEHGDANME